MEIPANYIRRIEIHGLWHRYDIAWDLRPDVNILAGINGVGKTTILNRSVGYLEQTTGAPTPPSSPTTSSAATTALWWPVISQPGWQNPK